MGFLGSLFGKEKEYPPLDRNSPAAQRLENARAAIEAFAAKINDKLEYIPTERAVYAFIGTPPDAFGVVWWSDGQEHNFKTLMKDKGISQARVQVLSDALRDSYKRHQGDERYSTTLSGKKVTVTPSEAFAADVEKIIREVG